MTGWRLAFFVVGPAFLFASMVPVMAVIEVASWELDFQILGEGGSPMDGFFDLISVFASLVQALLRALGY